MQEKKLSITKIFDRIKTHYSFKTDIQLANYLEVKPSSVSQSRSNNFVDLHKLLLKCSDMDMNYLLYGIESISDDIKLLADENAKLKEELKKNDTGGNFLQKATKVLDNNIAEASDEIEKLRLENNHLRGLLNIYMPKP